MVDNPGVKCHEILEKKRNFILFHCRLLVTLWIGCTKVPGKRHVGMAECRSNEFCDNSKAEDTYTGNMPICLLERKPP